MMPENCLLRGYIIIICFLKSHLSHAQKQTSPGLSEGTECTWRYNHIDVNQNIECHSYLIVKISLFTS